MTPSISSLSAYSPKLTIGLFIMAASCFVSAIAHSAVVDRTLTLTTQEWPPYQSSLGSRHSGIAIDALACVMKKLDQPYEITFLPWGRAQHDVKTGKHDGFFSASQNDTRDTFATLSNTFIEETWLFYLKKDTQITLNKDSLKSNATFGGRKHANPTHWLESNNFNVIHQTRTLDELIPLLTKGRIDAIMENKILFNNTISRANIPLSEFTVLPHIEKPIGVYFSNSFLAAHPTFLAAFNSHTEACRYSSTD